LGRKHISSNMPDWKDVVRAADHYAAELGGTIAVLLRPYGSQRQPAMTVVAELRYPRGENGEARPSVSASVQLTGGEGGALSAACLSALYELDREVYRRETGITNPTA
jgi:hypothetical protein